MKNFFVWIILLGIVGYGGAKLYMHNEVGDAVDMMVLQMAPFADVEYDGVASTLSGELTVEGEKYPIKAGDAVLVPGGVRHQFTNTGDVLLSRVTVNPLESVEKSVFRT